MINPKQKAEIEEQKKTHWREERERFLQGIRAGKQAPEETKFNH